MCLHFCPSIPLSCSPFFLCLPLRPPICLSTRVSIPGNIPQSCGFARAGKKLQDAYISTAERILSPSNPHRGERRAPTPTCRAREPRRLEGGWRALEPGGEAGAGGRDSSGAHQPLRPGTASMSKPAGSTSGYLSARCLGRGRRGGLGEAAPGTATGSRERHSAGACALAQLLVDRASERLVVREEQFVSSDSLGPPFFPARWEGCNPCSQPTSPATSLH